MLPITSSLILVPSCLSYLPLFLLCLAFILLLISFPFIPFPLSVHSVFFFYVSPFFSFTPTSISCFTPLDRLFLTLSFSSPPYPSSPSSISCSFIHSITSSQPSAYPIPLLLISIIGVSLLHVLSCHPLLVCMSSKGFAVGR